MGKNLINKDIFYTHTTADGIIYDSRPMPQEFIESNIVQSSGTAIRLRIIDPSEERKFKAIPGETGVYISDDGEQGYIGYYDCYLESDGSFTSGMFYVHPFHRNKGIVKNLIAFLESNFLEGLNEGDVVFNISGYSDKNVEKIAEETIDRSEGKVVVREPSSNES
jgi:GNAT superfamily N-acetyltransferase